MKVKTNPEDVAELSPQVLSLVSAFLAQQGLEKTNKVLRKELKKKGKAMDLPEVQEGVSLQTVVDSWNKKEQESTSDEESSEGSDAESSESGSESSSSSSGAASDQSSSSEAASTSASEAESENSSDDSSDEEEVTPKQSKVKRAKVNTKESSSSASSSSDSDADDEDEAEETIKPARKKSSKATKAIEPTRNLKRKAESSSEDDSGSDSSSDEGRPAKRVKAETESERSSSGESTSASEQESEASTSASEQKSSAEESSSSEEEADEEETILGPSKTLTSISIAAEAPSDDASSNTVMGDVINPGRTSSLSEDSAGGTQVISNSAGKVVTKKTHVGAHPTRLAQISAQAAADAHISNAYQSYDYAERAYNDLSVTRGRGFTKEKNKKKRGSYRGGAIDISGGKGFKFDD